MIILHPDPAPGATRPAHVVRGYRVVLHDRLGRRWLCTYPLNGRRVCWLLTRPADVR